MLAVAYFVSVILLAHFFAPQGYDWRINTISDLASQGHTYKWIMQAGFVGFGALLTAGVISYFRRCSKPYFLLLIAIYGLSILWSGIYCTAPIDPAIPYVFREAVLHSQFATLAGIALSLGILWQVFASSGSRERWVRFAFLLMVTGISGLFGLAENHILMLDKGVIQRGLYAAGLIWLVYEERMLISNKENL